MSSSQKRQEGVVRDKNSSKKRNTIQMAMSNQQDNSPEKGSESRVEKSPWEQAKLKMEFILDHNATTIIMSIITLYALFGDDVRILSTNKYGDPYFWVINIICMAAFALEIIVSSLCKEGYWNSFFFWLDVISTLSLLLDIGWFSTLLFDGQGNSAASAASLARAGRASRIGTKAGRIVRIIRLIRLVKLYKHATQALLSEAEINEIEEQQQQEMNPEPQSQNINQKLEERQNKKKAQAAGGGDTSPMNQGSSTIKQQQQIQQMGNSDLDGNRKSVGKLPPLQSGQNLGSKEVDGPSKPIILDKYKNDPLLNNNNNGMNQSDSERNMDKDENLARIHPMRADTIKEERHATTTPLKHGSSNDNIGGEMQESASKVKSLEEKEREKGGVPQETKVGQKLSDLTTRRVITLVLSIMFSVPIFTTNTWQEATSSYDLGLHSIYLYREDPVLFKEAMQNYIDFHDGIRAPIIYIEFEINAPDCCSIYPRDFEANVEDYKELRPEEIQIYSITTGSKVAFSVKDGRTDVNLDAILSIVRTLFVTIVLSVGAMSFSRDVEQLVLEPIESMLNKVQRIADNPLEAAQMEEKEALLFYELKEQKDQKQLKKKTEEEKMETVILEKLIIKIGALLAVGFGEAGSEIIAKNMRKGGAVDPMLPGQKVMAIFGFCDIRNFTDATEVLQTNVMVFVNEIAEITHGCVDEFCGQSNKNIGDAFLLVWKYNQEYYSKKSNGEVVLHDSKQVRRYSDLPVLAFIKIMQHLAGSEKLKKYKNNEGLNARIPGYDKMGVRMGFGLHQGWAIEGAIGSEFKIDASYLSPNVNMASRLEAATKQFGTGLLISGALQKTLTDQLQKELRHIDRVTVKGSIEPMDLYTIDISYNIYMEYKKKTTQIGKFDQVFKNSIQKKKKRVIDRLKRNKRRKDIEEGTTNIAKLFSTDQDLIRLRSIFSEEFYKQWNEAFQFYLKGEWPEALKRLQKSYTFLESDGFYDGPAKVLIDVIEGNKGKAPSDWQGYRSLTEK